jgi:hypothetical protein
MLKRSLAILATGAVAALALAPSAGAIENPKLDPYGAGAFASALEITLLGQDLAVSNTSAAITSTPEAKADGSALLLAGSPIPGAAPAAAPGGPATNQSCAIDLDLGELTGGAIDLADAHLACVNTSAVADKDRTQATSQSGEVIINVTAPAGAVLAPILEPLGDAVSNQVLDPLLDALKPLLDGVTDATQINLDQILRDLVDDVFSIDPNIVIAQVAVAPTHSIASATNAEGVIAEGSSSAATIRILPDLLQTLSNLLLPGTNIPALIIPDAQVDDALATIKVGNSVASVKRDPITGAADASASVAKILDVSLTPALGIVNGLVENLTGAVQSLTTGLSNIIGCNDKNFLADIVCIDLGVVKELTPQEMLDRNLFFGEGTVGRESTALTLRVLPILEDALGGDALALRLGTSTAAANAKPVAPAPAPLPQKLPKTGGGPSLPLAFLLMLGAGGASALVRRARTTSV